MNAYTCPTPLELQLPAPARKVIGGTSFVIETVDQVRKHARHMQDWKRQPRSHSHTLCPQEIYIVDLKPSGQYEVGLLKGCRIRRARVMLGIMLENVVV